MNRPGFGRSTDMVLWQHFLKALGLITPLERVAYFLKEKNIHIVTHSGQGDPRKEMRKLTLGWVKKQLFPFFALILVSALD